MKKQKGITLLEIMIITVIIGILAVVGFDMHRNSQQPERFAQDGCVLIQTVKGERVHRGDNQYHYPHFEAYRCERGDLIRSTIRYTDK